MDGRIDSLCVKNGAKGTYLTAAVQRCCGGVTLFLDGAALFLQRCCAEKALRWHVRFRLFTFADPSVETCVFSLTYGCIGGTCTFRSLTCKESRTSDPQQIFSVTGRAKFQFSELGEPCTFRELDTGNLRPPQQFDVSFVCCGIGFVRIADFFCILYLSLKNCKLYGSTYRTYPPLPICNDHCLCSESQGVRRQVRWGGRDIGTVSHVSGKAMDRFQC